MTTDSSQATRSRWADLKARVRIPQMLAALGLDSGFRMVGSRWVGPCPIHGGDNRTAFVVHSEKNVWFCFTRCGGGDSLALAYHLCGQSWPRVARWLAQLVGQIPTFERPAGVSPRPAPPERPFRPFRAALPLDATHPFFQRLQIAPATLSHFEAGAWHGRGWLEGTVAVRLHDLDGRPLGYAGRRLDPEQIERLGKWKWPPAFPKGRLLYNWHRVRPHLARGQDLIVVEGAWSVMKLWQAGFPNAVALCGCAATAEQLSLISRAKRVLLFLDGDDAGRAGTERLLGANACSNLSVVTCPSGQDPADLSEPTLRDLLTIARSQTFPRRQTAGNTPNPR